MSDETKRIDGGPANVASMRDWFALSAMQASHIADAIVTDGGKRSEMENWTTIASDSYAAADALLRVGRGPSEAERRLDRLHSLAMNIPCDVSAIAPEHVVGFQAGHKAARHAIAEMISQRNG